MSELDKALLKKWIETKERLLEDVEVCNHKIAEYKFKIHSSGETTNEN